jgi:DNA repair protein RecO (recombination protein O)
MTRWEDEGIILSLKKHGESRFIASLLTRHKGRQSGLIRVSKKMLLSTSMRVQARWSARLDEHLGYFQLEPFELSHQPIYPMVMGKRALWLASLLEILGFCLPERHPYQGLYERMEYVLEGLKRSTDISLLGESFIHFYSFLLQQLGHGLALEVCCVCARDENLLYISPKTGRAVCKEHGDPYKEKLFLYPLCIKACTDSCSNEGLQEKEDEAPRDSFPDAFGLLFYFLQKLSLYPRKELIHTQQFLQHVKKML